jgi:hypothetical protein
MLAALSLVIRQLKKRKNTEGGIGDKNINARLHGVINFYCSGSGYLFNSV